ncbi:MAG: metallophosphoesterase [Blastocatellia bacterium]|nr:metallophosphoesterase [Blastocatellia bacterium]
MDNRKPGLIGRRQALASLATLTAGTLIKPASIFSLTPVESVIRFAVLGDWGTGDDDEFGLARQMIEVHHRSAFDFILTAGDNIYPDGSGRHFVKHFEEPFAELLKNRVKFYAVLGNHDVREGREDQCRYPLFNMGDRRYYSISKGDGLAEFFMIDSTDFDQTQAGWLENALRISRAKWKIAVFHHPLYSSGKKHGSETRLRRKVEPLFIKYGVSVVFSGHDHIYQRTVPQNGIQYFVTGAGGKTRRGGVEMDCGYRAASYDEDNHFMFIELAETEMSFKAISEAGDIVDKGMIKKA